ncbi:MAG: hypothetical protein QG552_3263, partial [Thermodesulfobacteriota bacterium]|nr:hypothetical protein [Thermodesulfobacteriota bacterium]
VTKINTGVSGAASLVYSTYLGGTGSDFGYGIDVDASGYAYLAGHTTSADFPTSTAYQATLKGDADAFITKLSSTGSALSYSTYLGGTDVDSGYGIAVDASGNAYVTGQTYSNNFPTLGPFQAAVGGLSDAFITKLSSAGNTLSFSTYLGGSGADYGSDIAVDASGRAYVAGYTSSGNFPTKDPFQASFAGWSDAFITKLSTNGSALLYSTYLGGSDSDFANGIAVDATFGYAYVTGLTYSTNFPTQSPFQPNNVDSSDAFVTKANTIPPCPGCSGDAASLANVTFPSGTECECAGAISVTVGPNVLIESGARINFVSPKIIYQPGVDVKEGAVVRTRP